MVDPTPKNVKSVKSRLDTINQNEESGNKKTSNINPVQSHFLVPSEKLDKVTRRVIAPYAQIERKGLKDEEAKEGTYLDISRFNVFLEDTVDLDSLLYETAVVLKTITNSSEEGKVAAAHVAATKQYLLLEDVQRDRRFAEGLKWVDAKVALCMPVVKPDGDCYAVLELYKTYSEPYDDNVICTAVTISCWAGAAVHQAQARVTLQRTAHLNMELRALLQKYFCDLASIDTMLTDMLVRFNNAFWYK
ncbi:unnamed protein product [Parnassius apollo]|uniref:(apollo) hypothetical protein n=1 Tax=Parnassius apollo TaxID=110799 RepID=A0A8S3WRL8_PARAO|nr:unnamed protein product [Parnassius apollo]